MRAIYILILMALTILSASADGPMDGVDPWLNPDFGFGYQDGYPGIMNDNPDPFGGSMQYSTSAPAGAPAPIAPNNPDLLGLQIPQESTSLATQAPPTGEGGERMMMVSEPSAMGGGSGSAMAYSTYVDPGISRMVLPPGIGSPNRLYSPNVPVTVTSCSFNGWLPMWLNIKGYGQVWFYEWYPQGWLNVDNYGYASPGWRKMWFNGNTPGWHIMQYYCNGWSNYLYIYVYGGWGSGYSPMPGPSSNPWGPGWYGSSGPIVSHQSFGSYGGMSSSYSGSVGSTTMTGQGGSISITTGF
ncbi:MAG: hypothetical protein JW986_01705 [Methanotrichaceae archaeon]|nr:hypothetical protein [Methanotrichaceae archaeon]